MIRKDTCLFFSKSREQVMHTQTIPPKWFLKGIDAALLAPAAMNQQKFIFSLDGNVVRAEAGTGFYSKIDLGIAKYHFELGAGGQGNAESENESF